MSRYHSFARKASHRGNVAEAKRDLQADMVVSQGHGMADAIRPPTNGVWDEPDHGLRPETKSPLS